MASGDLFPQRPRTADLTLDLRPQFERRKLAFEPGQHLVIGPEAPATSAILRLFGNRDPWLEVLVKTIEGGEVSPSSPGSGQATGSGSRAPTAISPRREKRAAPLVLVATARA